MAYRLELFFVDGDIRHFLKGEDLCFLCLFVGAEERMETTHSGLYFTYDVQIHVECALPALGVRYPYNGTTCHERGTARSDKFLHMLLRLCLRISLQQLLNFPRASRIIVVAIPTTATLATTRRRLATTDTARVAHSSALITVATAVALLLAATTVTTAAAIAFSLNSTGRAFLVLVLGLLGVATAFLWSLRPIMSLLVLILRLVIVEVFRTIGILIIVMLVAKLHVLEVL